MDWWMWVLSVIGIYLLVCVVLIPAGRARGYFQRPEPVRRKARMSSSKNCLVCRHDKFAVTAEAGLGENVVCEKCGSLHLYSPFGLELLRAGTPSPKVVLPDGEKIEYGTDSEALEECATWNKAHQVRPGAYVIDSEGVMATDPLAPYGC